jgi:Uma2 family endonuclease
VIIESPDREDRPGKNVTFADWLGLPEDESGEFIDGTLMEEEVPDAIHEVIVAWLIGALRSFLIGQGGLVLGSEAKFAVSARRGRKPDASAYLPESRKPPRRGIIATPPDIMIEVISPTPRDARRDRVEKLQEYAAFGVRWYAIIDPEERTFELLELGADGRYAHARAEADGVIEAVPGLPGLTLDLDALWREVEQLGPASSDEPGEDR